MYGESAEFNARLRAIMMNTRHPYHAPVKKIMGKLLVLNTRGKKRGYTRRMSQEISDLESQLHILVMSGPSQERAMPYRSAPVRVVASKGTGGGSLVNYPNEEVIEYYLEMVLKDPSSPHFAAVQSLKANLERVRQARTSRPSDSSLLDQERQAAIALLQYGEQLIPRASSPVDEMSLDEIDKSAAANVDTEESSGFPVWGWVAIAAVGGLIAFSFSRRSGSMFA